MLFVCWFLSTQITSPRSVSHGTCFGKNVIHAFLVTLCYCPWSLWNVNLSADVCPSKRYKLINLTWDSRYCIIHTYFMNKIINDLMSWIQLHEKVTFYIWTIWIKGWGKATTRRKINRFLLESAEGLESLTLSKALANDLEKIYRVYFPRCLWVPGCTTAVWPRSSSPALW